MYFSTNTKYLPTSNGTKLVVSEFQMLVESEIVKFLGLTLRYVLVPSGILFFTIYDYDSSRTNIFTLCCKRNKSDIKWRSTKGSRMNWLAHSCHACNNTQRILINQTHKNKKTGATLDPFYIVLSTCATCVSICTCNEIPAVRRVRNGTCTFRCKS